MRRDTTNLAPFGLRLHDDLKAQIETSAQANGRSLNSEMVLRLTNSFSPLSTFTSGQLIDELTGRLATQNIYLRIGSPSAADTDPTTT